MSNQLGSYQSSVQQTRLQESQTQTIRAGRTPRAASTGDGGYAATQDLLSKFDQFARNVYSIADPIARENAKAQAYIDANAYGGDSSWDTGDSWNPYDKVYNDTRQSIYAETMDAKILADSQQAELDYEDNPVGYLEYMNGKIEGYSDTAPTPELKSVIQTSGKKYANRVYGSLATQYKAKQDKIDVDMAYLKIEKDKSKMVNLLELDVDGNYVNKDAEALIFGEEGLLTQSATLFGRLEREGKITKAEREAGLQELNYEVSSTVNLNRFEKLLQQKDMRLADEFMEKETKENKDTFTLEQNEKYQSEIKRMYNNVLKAKKADIKAAKDEANVIIGDAIEALKMGHMPEGKDKITNALFLVSEEKRATYTAYLEANNKIKEMDDLTLVELEDEIGYVISKKEKSPEDIAYIKLQENIVKNMRNKADKDPVGYYHEKNDIEAPDGRAENGVDGLIEAVGHNLILTHGIQQEFGNHKTELLTADEATSWNEWFNTSNEEVSSVKKIQALQALKDNFPRDYRKVLRQISKDKAGIMSFVSMMANKSNMKDAKYTLDGLNVDSSVIDEDTRNTITKGLAGVFQATSHKFKDYAKGVESYMKGHYVANNNIPTVVAAMMATIGVPVKIGKIKTLTPPGVDADTFETWIDELDVGNNALNKELRAMNDTFFDSEYRLHYVEPGVYGVVKYNSDEDKFVPVNRPDGEGKLILRYTK